MAGRKNRYVAFAVALVCALGASARADEPANHNVPAGPAPDPLAKIVDQARQHYQAGEKLYLQGRYPEALQEFLAGYELAPRPEFLLNLGQVQRKLGDRTAAIDMFEKFLLGTSPDDPRRAAVQDVVAELRAELNAQPEPPPQPLPPQPPHVAPPAVAAEHHWYRDWVGGTLTGVGMAGVGVGVGLFVSANSEIGDSGSNLDSYFAAKDAVTTRTIGLTIVGIGSALVISGVIHYIRESH